jgi:hypothetical protein
MLAFHYRIAATTTNFSHPAEQYQQNQKASDIQQNSLYHLHDNENVKQNVLLKSQSFKHL